MKNLACGQTKVGNVPEENLVQMGGGIKEWQPTTDSFFGLIMEYLPKLPKSLMISVASVMVLLVGILSHIAGPQLSFTIFYMIPIALVTWFTERWLGFIFSILSALTWLIADLTSGATYLQSDIPYWNGVARLGSLFILTFILSTLKNT